MSVPAKPAKTPLLFCGMAVAEGSQGWSRAPRAAIGLAGSGFLPRRLFCPQACNPLLRHLAVWNELQALFQHQNTLAIGVCHFSQPQPGRFVTWVCFEPRP